MKLLTTIQALILVALTVYGASAAADKTLHTPDCAPVLTDCPATDIAKQSN